MKQQSFFNNGRHLSRLVVSAVAFSLILFVFAGTEAFAKDRKYGLFIGINDYPGVDGDLYGAVNDARNWQSAMVDVFGFAPADTRLLLDWKATRQNIIDNINDIGAKTGPGDLFVVTYSGHGTLFPDEYSEEIDETRDTEVDLWFGDYHYTMPRARYDSAICPVDSDDNSGSRPWQNLILDDELYNLFAQFSAKGVKVVFISDSCHSGTIAKSETKDVTARPRTAPLARFFNARTYDQIKFMKPGVQKKVQSRTFNGFYLSMSGSKDEQVSWDASLKDGTSAGMFTFGTLSMIRSQGAKARNLTYSQLMAAVEDAVVSITEEGFPTVQTPQMQVIAGDPNTKIFQP